MQLHKLSEFKGGWFIGSFSPTVFSTHEFEVCYKYHKQGEAWPKHFHKAGTEFNLLVRGRMKMQDQIIEAGTIFIMFPYEIADPEFLEDCEVLIVKVPSVPGDKFEVQ